MNPETEHQANSQFRRLPKGERRVRFADTMGMELVSIFLFDLISNYYFASIHNNNSNIKSIQNNSHHNNSIKSIHSNLKSINNNNNQTISKNTIRSYQQPSQHELKQQQQNHVNQQYLSQQKQQPQQQQHHYHHLHHHQQQQQQPRQQSPSSQQHLQQQQQFPSYVCEFVQPISLISFKERVKMNKVHLETCTIHSRAGNISLACTIRVLNLSYDKSVIVRYSTDEWHTHTDTLASYKPGSNDGWSDKFTSTFSITNQVKQFQSGQRVIFAIRYNYDGDKISWDNNGGQNYGIKKI